MSEKFKMFFKQIKWWEYLLIAVSLSVVLALGIVFDSGWIVILSSVFGVLGVFFIAKGKIIGNFLAIIQSGLYCAMAYSNKLFGEFIVCLAVTIPLYIFTVVSWLRNNSKQDNVVKINKNIKKLEWLLIFAVASASAFGVYYLLRYFNTAHLLISTFSVMTCAIGGYLILRRSEFTFVFFIVNNLISICLWLFVIITNNNLAYIATIAQYGIFLILNSYGVYNWICIKRIQSMRKVILKRKSGSVNADLKEKK